MGGFLGSDFLKCKLQSYEGLPWKQAEASFGMLGLGRQWKPFFILLCKGVPVRCHHHDRVPQKEEIFITTVICRDLSL